jgi:hypothetical protein
MVGMVAFFVVCIQAQYKVRSKKLYHYSKDSDGNKQVIQTKEVEEVQSIEFKDADSKNLNKDIKKPKR